MKTSFVLHDLLCDPGLTIREVGRTLRTKPNHNGKRKSGGITHLLPLLKTPGQLTRKMGKSQFMKALKGQKVL